MQILQFYVPVILPEKICFVSTFYFPKGTKIIKKYFIERKKFIPGLPDPFAKITVDGSGQCHSTHTCKATLDPMWNQHYDL